jgi:hypothetical protein
MSEITDENVPHEASHAKAIDAHMRRTSGVGIIQAAPDASATYVQSEAQAAYDTINQILAVLRDAELIPD